MDNNEMNDTGAKKERWYQTTWFMWVMLVLFFPVGLFIMWKYKKHNLNARLIITAFFVLLMLGMPGTNKNTAKNDSAQQQQEQAQHLQKEAEHNALVKKEQNEFSRAFNMVTNVGSGPRHDYTNLYIDTNIRDGYNSTRREAEKAVNEVNDMETISKNDKKQLKEMFEAYDSAAGAASRDETPADLSKDREYIGMNLEKGKQIEDALRKELQDKVNEEIQKNLEGRQQEKQTQ